MLLAEGDKDSGVCPRGEGSKGLLSEIDEDEGEGKEKETEREEEGEAVEEGDNDEVDDDDENEAVGESGEKLSPGEGQPPISMNLLLCLVCDTLTCASAVLLFLMFSLISFSCLFLTVYVIPFIPSDSTANTLSMTSDLLKSH